MTGYGKSVLQLPGKKISIEIKSLNSKQADLNLRLPTDFRSEEAALRQKLSSVLKRGKIDCNLYCEITGIESAPQINTDLVRGYLRQMKALQEETGSQGDLLGAVMRLPEVWQQSEDELSEEEWQAVRSSFDQALEQIKAYRRDEGAKLALDLMERVAAINALLEEVVPLEEERKSAVRERLKKNLEQVSVEVDRDRFEQEIIYYLEKYDITEEKVRLQTHLDYFRELMKEGGVVGKKLGFVSQEMGREINTLGSKANHAGMQRMVVQMKDELEKIKEQMLNIL